MELEKCFTCTVQREEFSGFKTRVFLQGQQLMDLEHKLTVAKEELEKTALDKVNNTGDGVSPMSDDDRMNILCEVILVCIKTFFKEWISDYEG